jgi:hypothetical protein
MTPMIAVRADFRPLRPVPSPLLYCLPPMAIFGQKNRQSIFGGVETSMKMTFHSLRVHRSFSSSPRRATFHYPPFIFPLGKCVSQKTNRQT